MAAFISCDLQVSVLYVSSNAGAEALPGAQFGSAMGPIFLDQLVCSGSETSLLECRYYTPLGLSTCQHSQDAGVRCVGRLTPMFLQNPNNMRPH